MKLRRTDLILIVGIFLAAISVFLLYVLWPGGEGSFAVVTVDGKEQIRLPLAEDASYTISTGQGENQLQIRDGSAFISEADCPDKLCVHQRAISKTGETLVCLPHKMIVSIVGEEEADYDGIAQ